MKLPAVIAIPLLALTIAACGGSSNSSSSSSTAASSSTASSTPASTSTSASSGGASPSSSGGTVAVTMKSLAFSPTAVQAKVGQTVQWTNDDSPPHNVTYVSGPKFTSSPTLNPGAKFSIKLTQPGTIQYFCSIHPFMKATIVVSK